MPPPDADLSQRASHFICTAFKAVAETAPETIQRADRVAELEDMAAGAAFHLSGMLATLRDEIRRDALPSMLALVKAMRAAAVAANAVSWDRPHWLDDVENVVSCDAGYFHRDVILPAGFLHDVRLCQQDVDTVAEPLLFRPAEDPPDPLELSIVELLKGSESSLSVQDIASKLSRHREVVGSRLQRLADAGVVERDTKKSPYRLKSGAFPT